MEEITVGMGMTRYTANDKHAYEVIDVDTQEHVYVREYDVKPLDDNPYSNNWELVSNPTNKVEEMVLRDDGWYFKVSHNDEPVYFKVKVEFGKAEYYYDHDF